jgi:hypothetical protein
VSAWYIRHKRPGQGRKGQDERGKEGRIHKDEETAERMGHAGLNIMTLLTA